MKTATMKAADTRKADVVTLYRAIGIAAVAAAADQIARARKKQKPAKRV